MDCDYAKRLISLYIDNEMDEKERSEFEEHINSCEACRNELKAISETVKLLRGIPQVELPLSFKEELHEKLVKAKEEENRNRRRGLFFIRNRYLKAVSTIAAGAFVIFALRGLLFNSFMTKGDISKSTSDSAIHEAAIMEKALADMKGSNQSEDPDEGLARSGAIAGEQDKSLTINAFTNENTSSVEQKTEKEDEYSGAVTKSSVNDVRNFMLSNPDLAETTNRGEAEGFGIPSINARSYSRGVNFNEDIFLKNAIVKVKIIIYEDVSKIEALEKIIQSFETWDMTTEDNINDENNNVSILEFSIKGSEYANLAGKVKSEMEASNLSVEYGNPILVEDFKVKYDEYLSQLEKVNNQLSSLSEDKNNSNSSEKTKLIDDKDNIENSIKILLEKFEYVANVEMHINVQ